MSKNKFRIAAEMTPSNRPVLKPVTPGLPFDRKISPVLPHVPAGKTPGPKIRRTSRPR